MPARNPSGPPAETRANGGKARRLKRVKDVRVFVAHVLREVERGNDISDPLVARVLIHGAQVLATVIVNTDLEERIAKIERGEVPERRAEAH